MSWISAIPGGVRIQVKVQPRAARNEVAGIAGDHLRVRLTAPPVEGEANRLLQKYLSEVFRCSPGNVRIIRGSTGRLKLLEITGISEADALKLVFGSIHSRITPVRTRRFSQTPGVKIVNRLRLAIGICPSADFDDSSGRVRQEEGAACPCPPTGEDVQGGFCLHRHGER